MATTMFIRHRVSDFGLWRQVYQEVAPMQRAGGVIAEAVYQGEGDPNDVTVTHEFASPEAAQEFMESTDLKAAMDRAGVLGAPTIWITERT